VVTAAIAGAAKNAIFFANRIFDEISEKRAVAFRFQAEIQDSGAAIIACVIPLATSNVDVLALGHKHPPAEFELRCSLWSSSRGHVT